MKLTDAMRTYALQKGWVAAGATDDQIRAALATRLTGGELSAADWASLNDNKVPSARDMVVGIVNEAVQGVEQRLTVLINTLVKSSTPTPAPTPAPTPTPTPTPTPAPNDQAAAFEAAVQKSTIAALRAAGIPIQDGETRISPTQFLSRSAEAGYIADPSVRVKSPIEGYDKQRKEVRYPLNSKHLELRGQLVTFPDEIQGGGRPIEAPSMADKAIIGAWFRWALHSGGHRELPPGLRMTDHDWALVKHAVHELPWTGTVGGENGTGVDSHKLADVMHRGVSGVKAILDDSTSGGIYAAPQIVEDAIIMTPLLYGELFPYVTVQNLTRGRRITGPTMGTPTFTSGTPEGTAISLFDTTNFIGSLDTSIFTAVGAMEIGRDFEEDSPANIGSMVISRYGEAAKQWLDRVVALGDGTSEPKGIFLTTGTTSVSATNGAAGPLLMTDAEGLFFGVNKAFRTSRGGRNVMIGNEVNYRRFRGIPIGSGYNTRAFGESYNDYTVLGHPFKIVPSVPNTKIAYVNLAYYRMYRRLGMNVRVETGGKELTLKNLMLIAVRMRYGGQIEQGGAVALMTDAPA